MALRKGGGSLLRIPIELATLKYYVHFRNTNAFRVLAEYSHITSNNLRSYVLRNSISQTLPTPSSTTFGLCTPYSLALFASFVFIGLISKIFAY
jgi:hypothetical protein